MLPDITDIHLLQFIRLLLDTYDDVFSHSDFDNSKPNDDIISCRNF